MYRPIYKNDVKKINASTENDKFAIKLSKSIISATKTMISFSFAAAIANQHGSFNHEKCECTHE